MTHDTLTARLAAFVAGTTPGDSASAAQVVTKLSCLDWLAVGIAGRDEPVARICREMVLDEGGVTDAHVFGSRTRLPARAAALSNGTTSHALDYDDTHFAHIGHPSVAVFPAAVALGEKLGAATASVLEAALIGMEVSIRVGIWLGRAHYQTGFHQTATAGAFGGTAAAARILGFTADQTAAAFGLTATRASGLKAQFGTMGKPFNAGIAASNGVEAALLIQRGFVPNPQALEGPLGFGAIHAGEGAVEAALAGLGEMWHFETVSHKFHACCHGLHATLEALAQLPAVDPDRIARIDIDTHPRWMTVCNQPTPTTGLGAKFSYTTVTAMALLGHATARLDSYTDAVCADPDVIALRDKVTVTPDDRLSETAARVTMHLTDGTAPTAAFDLDAPMTLEDRTARVKAKASALIGSDRADAIWTALNADAPLGDLTRILSAD